MKVLEVALVLLLPTWLGIMVLANYFKTPAGSSQTMEMDGKECIDACIKAMRSNQVFPDFQAIIKDCDARYGDGCRLVKDAD